MLLWHPRAYSPSSRRRRPRSGEASVPRPIWVHFRTGIVASRRPRLRCVSEARPTLRPPRSRLASARAHLRPHEVVSVNQRLASARTSAGPRFSKPVTDNFQVAHFKANQIAFSHVVEIRRSGVSTTTSPFPISSPPRTRRPTPRRCRTWRGPIPARRAAASRLCSRLPPCGGRRRECPCPRQPPALPDAAGSVVIVRAMLCRPGNTPSTATTCLVLVSSVRASLCRLRAERRRQAAANRQHAQRRVVEPTLRVRR
jgi:hypothetical protein